MANSAGWMNIGGVTVVGAATITAADDRLSVTAHGLADGDLVMVDTLSGGGTELREGSTYVVRNPNTDDFQLSTPSGAAVFDFQADGSARVLTAVPSYAASDLRRIDAIHLHPGSADRLGAREGVRPHSSDAVTIAAGTYTVAAGTAVVYPAETTTSGPYVVTYDAASDSVDPADGSNPRLDGVDLQVQDDDEDGSGQRSVQIVYVPGTPASSPTAPAVTDNALRLATILVPAGDETSSTIDSLAQYALGAGVLPVRDDTERPTSGRYEGMTVFRQDTDALEVWDGSAWSILAASAGFQLLDRIVYTSSSSFDKTAYPGLRAVHVEVQAAGGGGGGTNATAAGEAGVGGGGGGGEYRRGWILDASLSDSTTVTVGAGGAGGANAADDGNTGGVSSFGSHVSCNGGGGGTSNDVGTGHLIATGGNGGAGGSGGYLTIPGDDGDNGYRAGGAVTGGLRGGASHLGGSQRGNGTTAGGNGGPGQTFGGGGSAGHNNQSEGSSRSGGTGGQGVVVVEVYG